MTDSQVVQKQQILMQKNFQFIKLGKGVRISRLKQQIFFYPRAQPNGCKYYEAPLQGSLPYTLGNRYHGPRSQNDQAKHSRTLSVHRRFEVR